MWNMHKLQYDTTYLDPFPVENQVPMHFQHWTTAKIFEKASGFQNKLSVWLSDHPVILKWHLVKIQEMRQSTAVYHSKCLLTRENKKMWIKRLSDVL